MAWYRTGTISVTNGSDAVVGAGTDFVTNVRAGEALQGPDGRTYEILTIVSATSITLAEVYLGSTQSAQAYSIIPTLMGRVRDLTDSAQTLISDFQTIVDEAGAGKFPAGTGGLPGIQGLIDANTGWDFPGADIIDMYHGGTKRTITAAIAGYLVGMQDVAATAIPAFAGLDVTSADGADLADYIVKINNNDVTAGQGHGLQIKAGNGASDGSFYVTDRAGNPLFYVRGDGNICFGGTNPVAPLHIAKAFGSGADIWMGFENTTGGGYGDWAFGKVGDNDLTLFSDTGGLTTTNPRFTLSFDGELTLPGQPAFMAQASGSQINIAVSTIIDVILGTEVFDVGANFASNTFTAPVSGKYQLNVAVRVDAVDTAASYYRVQIETSNRVYQNIVDPNFTADLSYLSLTLSALADMDAGDTAKITIYQNSGTSQSDIQASSVFSGILVA